MMEAASDPSILLALVRTRMPFGKYKDRLLMHLPEEYLLWFKKKGFPPGKLGQQLALMYEIKSNGLEYLLQPLLKM
ncbi:DUF3820 family protein [Cesiribacter andamanensis]|uniref:DNA polymerase III subunit epsilon n=1 Tax=Cesiribacter andamanensis AMV16 TaxID=1279009 RepID=M7N1M6_9BACT|nr:DUF3820 family protein [Cesiribacter andamanensis]EMR01126.1 hypothetical protein ADICEAN_03748 [Cesiribacter andamanensis AMV16]